MRCSCCIILLLLVGGICIASEETHVSLRHRFQRFGLGAAVSASPVSPLGMDMSLFDDRLLSVHKVAMQSELPLALLDNPQPGSFQSGVGLIQGWVCEAETVTIEIDGSTTFTTASGTTRRDTLAECGDDNNGFGLTVNWNLLGDGQHTVRALADGVEFAQVTFTVATLGLGEFPQGLDGEFSLVDFPLTGQQTTIRWQESLQNFMVIGGESAINGEGFAGLPPGVLDNPQPGSFPKRSGPHSGLGV